MLAVRGKKKSKKQEGKMKGFTEKLTKFPQGWSDPEGRTLQKETAKSNSKPLKKKCFWTRRSRGLVRKKEIKRRNVGAVLYTGRNFRG